VLGIPIYNTEHAGSELQQHNSGISPQLIRSPWQDFLRMTSTDWCIYTDAIGGMAGYVLLLAKEGYLCAGPMSTHAIAAGGIVLAQTRAHCYLASLVHEGRSAVVNTSFQSTSGDFHLR
jgi:hypothetical protein